MYKICEIYYSKLGLRDDNIIILCINLTNASYETQATYQLYHIQEMDWTRTIKEVKTRALVTTRVYHDVTITEMVAHVCVIARV